MKLNPSVTHSFSVLLLILLLFVGCGEEMTDEEMTGPEIATVKIEFTLPNPPTPSVDGPFCKTGDILQPGESCFYPGTDIEMSVLDDGTLNMLNLFLNSRQIHFENTTLNDFPFTLIAHRRNDNSWKIEKLGDAGDAGKLDVIVSTNYIGTFSGGSPEFIYNTKNEFSLTESFSQDFRLDSDDPMLAVKITNNTPHDLSVHLTVLVDGEVEADERDLFTSRSRSLRWWSWGTANE